MMSFHFNKKFLLLTGFLCVLDEITALGYFTCPKKTPGSNTFPQFPDAYSTNIRVNFLKDLTTVETRHVVKGDKESFEIWTDTRHVKYIKIGHQQLLIRYSIDSLPKCSVKTIPNVIELEKEDAGPQRFLSKVFDVFYDEGTEDATFEPSGVSTDLGVFAKTWEGCFTYPKINISMSFTAENWNEAHLSLIHKGYSYPVSLEAQIGDDFMVALFSNFDPKMPADLEFQPPENTYCEGLKSTKKFPGMTNFFRYDSEIIEFRSAMGYAPVSAHRTIYYDYPGGISRSDLYDPVEENPDLFSPVTSEAKVVIYDYNSGIQYDINPISGKCEIDDFSVTVTPIEIVETKGKKMLTGLQFFALDTEKYTYNGEYPTRGYIADVFTAPIYKGHGKEIYIYTWYFSTGKAQVVENDNVEKDVLLRMVVRPEDADEKEGEIDVNFYNFVKAEPAAFTYDVTTCYNESLSKTFVLSFPENDGLRDSEKLLKNRIHLAIKDTANINKQRVFVSQVVFSKPFIFAEFKILARPDALIQVKSTSMESTLEQAIEKLKKSVSSGNFAVDVPVKGKIISLKPMRDGLNELDGYQKRVETEMKYGEGSVIGITVAMLFLGFLVGAITINLVVSKKFGVSLLQSKRTTRDPFSQG